MKIQKSRHWCVYRDRSTGSAKRRPEHARETQAYSFLNEQTLVTQEKHRIYSAYITQNLTMKIQ